MSKFKENSLLLKRILLGVMFAVLLLPLIQHRLAIIEVKPLEGAITSLERPTFSSKDWHDGIYQTKLTDYLNQNVGFRNWMVRTYNQIHFSFYNIARANGVIIGRDDYLYEGTYIDAYQGIDFRGNDSIALQVRKLKKVSDTLQALGKHVVVLLAPGKASFYPEYIPQKSQKNSPKNLNLKAYAKYLQTAKIPTMNLNTWFIQNKYKSKYPLFPKTGIHWSKYGEMIMADTLISFLNHLPGVQVPEIKVDKYSTSFEVKDTDDDIERGMNLLFNIADNQMAYPTFHIVSKPKVNYAKVLTIADSYFWGPFNWGMSRDVFSGGQFWYYNEAIYPDSYEKPLYVKDVDFGKSMQENDVILILCTDGNLPKFGFGFVELAYQHFFSKK